MLARIMLMLALGLMTACQTTTAPTTASSERTVKLPPMSEPALESAGYATIVQVDGSKPGRHELVKVTPTRLVWQDANGCEWERSREYDRHFAPSVEWRNCNGSSGTLTIHGRSGDPEWPLELGKKWKYRATGHTQSGWSADEACEVVGTARIETVSGTHETYKVVCSSKWSRITRYYSPDLGVQVRYQRERLAGAVTDVEVEWVRRETAAES